MHQHAPRKKRNSAKVNLIFSGIFHAVIIGGLLFFAAREGVLGNKLKTLAVQMTKKEKKPEEEKKKEEPKKEEKPPEQKPEEKPKVAEQKVAAVRPQMQVPPPVTTVAPNAAPPPVAPTFTFQDPSAKTVVSTSDPVQLYKNFIESTIRSRWNRPEGVADDNYVADVDLVIDLNTGKIIAFDIKKGSGDSSWDNSIKTAIEKTGQFSKPPPKSFPSRFLVRFDTVPETEPMTLGKP